DAEFAGERGPRLSIEPLLVLTLKAYGTGDVSFDDCLDIIGEPLPSGQVRKHIESRPHVIRDAHVLHDLVMFEEVHIGEWILLCIDLACLERFVDSAAVDGDRLRTQRPEGVLEDLTRRNAHTDGCEISGHTDRTLRASYLPHTVVEDSNGKAPNTFRGHFLTQVGTELAVQRSVRMGGGPKGERHLLHFRHRHDISENPAHEREKLNLARNEHLERLRIAAGNFVVFREDRGYHAPVGLGANGCPHLHKPQVERTVACLVVVLREVKISSPE